MVPVIYRRNAVLAGGHVIDAIVIFCTISIPHPALRVYGVFPGVDLVLRRDGFY